MTRASSSTSTSWGCSVGDVTTRDALWICRTSSDNLMTWSADWSLTSEKEWKAGGVSSGRLRVRVPLANESETPDMMIESPTRDRSPEALQDHPCTAMPESDSDQVN